MLELRNGTAYVTMGQWVRECRKNDGIPERLMRSMIACISSGHYATEEYGADGLRFMLVFDTDESYFIDHTTSGTGLGSTPRNIYSLAREVEEDISEHFDEWVDYSVRAHEGADREETIAIMRELLTKLHVLSSLQFLKGGA